MVNSVRKEIAQRNVPTTGEQSEQTNGDTEGARA